MVRYLTARLFFDEFVKLASREGIPPEFSHNYYCNSQGAPLAGQFNFMLDRYGVNCPGKAARLANEFWSDISAFDLDLFPGVAAALARAKEMDLELLASSSSKTGEIEKNIKKPIFLMILF